MSDNHQRGDDAGVPIQPARFEPLDGPARATARRWRPLAIVIAVALIAVVLAAWFVVTGRALQVHTDPADARLRLSGGPALRLGSHYLVRPGDYRLHAQAEGYHPLLIDIRVDDTPSRTVEAVLEPLPGILTVTSTPEATEVLIDGQSRGTTPLTLEDLQAGAYRLALRTPRYRSREETIEITGFGEAQALDWSLEPAWGEVTLQSLPEGAEVSVAGERRGTTPLTVEIVEPGESVTVKLAGHKQWQQTVAIGAGERLTLPAIELEPADGLVQVHSQPAGAALTVNGRFRGQTPVELELSPDAEHELSLFLEGYRTARRSVAVTSGQEQTLDIRLEPDLAELRIEVEPASAEVRVDGTPRNAGTTLQLPARAHRITVSAPGYLSHEQTVTPRPGVAQTLNIRLTSEAEARRAERPARITTRAGQTLLLMEPTDRFTMGSSRREPGRRANEVMRDIRLQRPFYLADKPVTNDQFRRFRESHSSSHAERQTLDTAQQPVVRVTWTDAALYCNWLSEQEGLTPFYTVSNGEITGYRAEADGYRLPTEAEWEWAARTTPGGDLLTFPWGDGFPPTTVSGNYADASARHLLGTTLPDYNDRFAVSAPVGRFTANARGLYDMGSNVAEWVHDRYGIHASVGTAAEVDPLGPDSGEFRVIRGASWRHGTLTELRLSFRDYGNQARDDVGFRVARYLK